MRKWLLAVAAATVAAAPALAWNDRGHMVVAAKAWQHLTPQTRSAVGRLLRHNPRYASWTAGVPQAQKARAAFIHASTWPDYIKNAEAYYQDRLPNRNSRRNIGYSDCYQHRYWHYKDLPFSPDGTPLRDPPEPNAETQIEAFRATIADPAAADQLKSYDLAWLLHLVGDIHQPLHATQRFVASDADGDGGGNDVKYCLTSNCRTGSSLHSFWDGALGNGEDLAEIVGYAAQLDAPPEAEADERDVAAWFAGSFELAKAKVYQPPIGTDLARPFLLTNAYRNGAAATAIRQVSLGGVRLAKMLNAAKIGVRGDAVQALACAS